MTPESQSHPRSTPGAGRLFLAVPITAGVRNALRVHLEGVHLPGRVVPPERWHLTLRFLGETSTEALDQLREMLDTEELGGHAVITFDRLGAFPHPARGSVLWLGIGEGADALRTLAGRVERAARRAGFPAEGRPFSPHLTLSRLRPPEDVRGLIERTPPFPERMPVGAVVLYRSHLSGGPVRYEEVGRFPLSPPPR